MSHSVWLYVSVSNDCVKVFASCDAAIEWLREKDPEGAAVEYPIEEEHAPSMHEAIRYPDVDICVLGELSGARHPAQRRVHSRKTDGRAHPGGSVGCNQSDRGTAALRSS
jgi:hypothetical protein